jgi:hypothetical protein
MHSRFAAFGSREQHNTQHFNGGMYTAAGASGAIGLLEPGAVIVVGSTVGITLEGVLTAAVFRLMMAGGSTETGASRAMLELKLLEDTVPDGVCVVGCVVDGVCDDWLGLKRLYDCTPKLGLETSALVVKLEQLENTVLDDVAMLLSGTQNLLFIAIFVYLHLKVILKMKW